MRFMMKVSVFVLMLMIFQTGDCGMFGKAARRATEISRMAPMQRVEARRNFWAEIKGELVRPAPAPVAVPAQCGASASDSNEGSNERGSFDPSSVNESDQSDLRNSQVVSRFPTPGDDIFDDFIGKENNVVEGTVLWLVEQFCSPSVNREGRRSALKQFLKSYEFFSKLRSSKSKDKLTAGDLRSLMNKAGDSKEAKVSSVYNALAEAVEKAEQQFVEAK